MPEYINNENFGSFIKYPNRIRVLLTKKIIFFSLVFFFNIYDSRPDNCVAIKNGTWSSDIIKFGIRSSYKTATLQISITVSYGIKPIFPFRLLVTFKIVIDTNDPGSKYIQSRNGFLSTVWFAASGFKTSD
jgi:hypothetical protein